MQKQYDKGQTAEQDCRSNTTKVKPQNRIAEATLPRSIRRNKIAKNKAAKALEMDRRI
jgi:hypothetical protein